MECIWVELYPIFLCHICIIKWEQTLGLSSNEMRYLCLRLKWKENLCLPKKARARKRRGFWIKIHQDSFVFYFHYTIYTLSIHLKTLWEEKQTDGRNYKCKTEPSSILSDARFLVDKQDLICVGGEAPQPKQNEAPPITHEMDRLGSAEDKLKAGVDQRDVKSCSNGKDVGVKKAANFTTLIK